LFAFLADLADSSQLAKSAFLAPAPRPLRRDGYLRRHRPDHVTILSAWEMPYGKEGSPEALVESVFGDRDSDRGYPPWKARAGADGDDAMKDMLMKQLYTNATLCWYLVDTYWAMAGDAWRNRTDSDFASIGLGERLERRREMFINILAIRQRRVDPNGTQTIERFEQAERELNKAWADMSAHPDKYQVAESGDPYRARRRYWAWQSRCDAWQKIFDTYADSANPSMEVLVKKKQIYRAAAEWAENHGAQYLGDAFADTAKGLNEFLEREAEKQIIERVEGKKEPKPAIDVKGIDKQDV